MGLISDTASMHLHAGTCAHSQVTIQQHSKRAKTVVYGETNVTSTSQQCPNDWNGDVCMLGIKRGKRALKWKRTTSLAMFPRVTFLAQG